MGFQHRAGILRMELSTYEPTQLRNLHDFHQTRLRIATYTLHALCLVFIEVLIVKLTWIPPDTIYINIPQN